MSIGRPQQQQQMRQQQHQKLQHSLMRPRKLHDTSTTSVSTRPNTFQRHGSASQADDVESVRRLRTHPVPLAGARERSIGDRQQTTLDELPAESSAEIRRLMSTSPDSDSSDDAFEVSDTSLPDGRHINADKMLNMESRSPSSSRTRNMSISSGRLSTGSSQNTRSVMFRAHKNETMTFEMDDEFDASRQNLNRNANAVNSTTNNNDEAQQQQQQQQNANTASADDDVTTALTSLETDVDEVASTSGQNQRTVIASGTPENDGVTSSRHPVQSSNKEGGSVTTSSGVVATQHSGWLGRENVVRFPVSVSIHGLLRSTPRRQPHLDRHHALVKPALHGDRMALQPHVFGSLPNLSPVALSEIP